MEPTRLTKILTERGLVERFVIDQTLVKLRPRETLADRLVADAVISETDLLRAVAQATGTKFISSPRIQDLKVSPQVTGMIPLDAARMNDVLPIAYDAVRKALTVVVADPSKMKTLDDLPTVGNMNDVIVNVGMPGAIRAAIQRVYGLESRDTAKTEARPDGACPQCAEPFFSDQLECANCGLLLNPDAPVDNTEARIVRALLSQPSGIHRIRSRTQVLEGATRRGFPMEVSLTLIPEVIAGLDIVRSLSEFEAFVISFVDAQRSVAELSSASGLMEIEVQSVVASLIERKTLQLNAPPVSLGAEVPVLYPVLLPKPKSGEAARSKPAAVTRSTEAPKVATPPAGRVATEAPSRPGAAPSSAGRAAVPAAPATEAPSRPGAAQSSAGRAAVASAGVPAPTTTAGPGKGGTLYTGPAKRAKAPEPVVAKPAEEPLEPARPVKPEAIKPMELPRHMNPQAQMENSIQHALKLEARGEIEGAISVLKNAIARTPKPGPLYNRLALVILNQRQDARQAEQLIHKALELDPENPVYKANLVKVLGYAAGRRR